MKLRLLFCLILFALEASGQEDPSYVEGNLYSQNVFGGVGLIQTPTSRMEPAGNLSINYSDNEEYRFWSVSLQLFPWMESTVRYTDVRNLLYSNVEAFSGDQTWKDKGIDVKFRLLKEDFWLPELSVGFKDIGGTGVFSSEYITASKRWGNIDFHLGLGFGYLGRNDNVSNPFCDLAERFCERTNGYSGRGGKVEFNKFFTGPAALFGGIEYQTPWRPLRVSVEYDANNYASDKAPGIVQDSRFNIAANYRFEDLDLSLRYERGNTITFGVSYQLDFNTLSQPKFAPAIPQIKPTPTYNSLRDLDKQDLVVDLNNIAGYRVKQIISKENQLYIYGNQVGYRLPAEGNYRAASVLVNTLPTAITHYNLVELAGNTPLLQTKINANEFKNNITGYYKQDTPNLVFSRMEPDKEALSLFNRDNKVRFGSSFEGFFIQSFGNPESFYMYQGGVMAHGNISVNSSLSLIGTLKATLFENLDEYNFKTDQMDTPLPRVRTNLREYVTRKTVTMENLFAHSMFRLDENIFVQGYVGYLESMFGGAGVEWLYRPVDTNWSFGMDLNYVAQRSYENEFGFLDYRTFTGHVNATYEPNIEGLKNTRFSFKVGQFLAKDKGVQVEFAKRFDSGIVVGAYAAFTNVSAEEYGEGSFTKGFYITIPVDIFTFTPATGYGKFPWIPIARDGGQILQRPVKLLDLTEKRSRFMN